MLYTNWKCYAYHLYGDNSKKEYSYKELSEHFNITGEDFTECIKDKTGDGKQGESYSFTKGKLYSVYKTNDGMFRIR